MMNKPGIELLTVFGMPPVEYVTLAADLGCGHISTGLTALPWKFDDFPDWSLRDNPQLRRELMAVLRDREILISLGEGFAVRPGVEVRDYARDLDIMAELATLQIGSVCMEPDISRTIDQLALLAEMSAEREMGFTLEFAPPHPINTLEKAVSAITSIGSDNARLVIDAMHFFRSGSSLEALAAVDPRLLGYAQLCDVPLIAKKTGIGNDSSASYYEEACFERLVPGEGELPLRELIDVLPDDILYSLEVPMRTRARDAAGVRAAVEDALRGARQVLGCG